MKPIDIGSLTNSQTTNLTITVADPPPNLLKHGLCSFNEWKPMGWMRRDFIGVPFSESTTRCCCFFSLGYFSISKHTCISVYIYIYIILCIYHANHIIQPYNIYMHTSNCYDFHLVDALFLFEHFKIRKKIAHPQKRPPKSVVGRSEFWFWHSQLLTASKGQEQSCEGSKVEGEKRLKWGDDDYNPEDEHDKLEKHHF